MNMMRGVLGLLVVIYTASAAAAAEESSKIDPEKVPVAKAGGDDKSFEEIKSAEPLKKPVSLSKKDKAATVKHVRTLAGVAKGNLAPAPPALITLSPDSLTQGKSWLGMLKGAVRPKSSEKDTSYMTIGPKDGVFLLYFEPMVPGSPYLLDCEVATHPEGEMVWEIHGAYNGVVEDQNGHLLIGFIPSDSKSNLSISRHKGVVIGHLFKCELTRVD